MNSINVLVIEDEVLIAENIRLLLEDFGYNVTDVCYKYKTALAALQKTDYDIIITDINLGHGMREKSGITLMEELKKIKKCPFIFLTAFGDKDTIVKASALYPSAYLVKPVTPANLYASIQVAVENFNSVKTVSLQADKKEMPEHFFIKVGNNIIKVLWKDVYAMVATKNYVLIKTQANPNGLPIRSSLQQVQKLMLPAHLQHAFVKINRSEVIAKRIIKKIGESVIETDEGNYNYTVDLNLL